MTVHENVSSQAGLASFRPRFVRTGPPIFNRLASAYPRTSAVMNLSRRLFRADNPTYLDVAIQRAWDHHRLPRFNNYRQGMDE
jgi:hypothetical protein